MTKNTMVTFEGFKKNMDWNTMEFTPDQLKNIYNGVVENEYATFDEINNDYEIEENDMVYIVDVNLHSVVEFLGDLENEIVYQVLTSHYGYNGTTATIYYLKDDNSYCLVMFN